MLVCISTKGLSWPGVGPALKISCSADLRYQHTLSSRFIQSMVFSSILEVLILWYLPWPPFQNLLTLGFQLLHELLILVRAIVRLNEKNLLKPRCFCCCPIVSNVFVFACYSVSSLHCSLYLCEVSYSEKHMKAKCVHCS